MTQAPSVPRRPVIEPRPIDLDGSITWGCSGRGWNCCIDKAIPVHPYDMLRLRHATGTSSRDLINSRTVTFDWDASGLLVGWLARVPYARSQQACVFFEEVTNLSARRMRERDPHRFATMPESVRLAADDTRGGERRVAGLCRAHSGRPEACRGFPFQRDPLWSDHPERAASKVFDCGSCALATPTTPREVMLDNDLDEYWRADEAWRAVARYLHSLGLANVTDARYRRLPLAPEQRTALWLPLYVPDAHPEVARRFPEHWQRPLDIDGDLEVYRLLLTEALDRADAALATSGRDRSAFGGPEGAAPRPDVAALLDAGRPVLPPRLVPLLPE